MQSGPAARRAAAWAVLYAIPLVSASFLSGTIFDSSEDQVCQQISLENKYVSRVDKFLKRPTSATCTGQMLACSANVEKNRRRKQTSADHYFAQHKLLPQPPIIHATLPVVKNGYRGTNSNKILVVGDVHGCMAELQSLVEIAMRDHNDDRPFSFIILVGDLCNKGPRSADVIRWARTTPTVLSVRGNHDDGALAAALGDQVRRQKKKYRWVMEGEGLTDHRVAADRIALSDDDVVWLSQLPYTLTIPGWYLGEEQDTVIVHAGLIPNVPLEDQSISTMITIREVLPVCQNSVSPGVVTRFEYHERQKGNPANEDGAARCNVPMPWAMAWSGPQRIIFGHDARRGFQRYEGDYAIGLDTGAVYGKRLTGLILPERTVVSVSSKMIGSLDHVD